MSGSECRTGPSYRFPISFSKQTLPRERGDRIGKQADGTCQKKLGTCVWSCLVWSIVPASEALEPPLSCFWFNLAEKSENKYFRSFTSRKTRSTAFRFPWHSV